MRSGDIECSGPCCKIVRSDFVPPGWRKFKVAVSDKYPHGEMYYCPSCPVPPETTKA